MTAAQLSDITTIERVASIFSLLGCLWISLTFLGSRSFQKPINRLVFYASAGNIFTNAATIMSRDFLSDPRGAGCQVQAFFIQMLVLRYDMLDFISNHIPGLCQLMLFGHLLWPQMSG
jgi:hypothetical protein